MSLGTTDVPVEVSDACPIMEVLDHVSGKWAVGVLTAVGAGPVRFTELERAVDGISRRMLTLTLRRLERDGLLTRTVYPTVPPKVEYQLTDIARELQSALSALVAWADRSRTAVRAAQRRYDTASDEVLQPLA